MFAQSRLVQGEDTVDVSDEVCGGKLDIPTEESPFLDPHTAQHVDIIQWPYFHVY